MQLPVLPTF